uniref:Uncharacterized protein n=1 Tax=Steinernema glaseri TaxID=37863 RepID=A0A1I7Y6K5_9BILA
MSLRTVMIVLFFTMAASVVVRDECWEQSVELLLDNCDGLPLPCVKGGRLDSVPEHLIPKVTRCCGADCTMEQFRSCQ